MKKIIEIFKTDMKKVWKRKIAVIILIGLLFIPGIYAWLNIDSNWNPYDNTGNLPIAVVNKDQGLTILNENINMGSLLVDSLKSNTAMKWIFTDEEDAKTNVDKGKYYGVIILPEDYAIHRLHLPESADNLPQKAYVQAMRKPLNQPVHNGKCYR